MASMVRIYELNSQQALSRARRHARELGLTVQPTNQEGHGVVAELGASGAEAALERFDAVVARLGGSRVQ